METQNGDANAEVEHQTNGNHDAAASDVPDGLPVVMVNGGGAGGDDDDGGLLDRAEHAASASRYRKARRESFRQQAEESMLNPTPAMLRQSRSMREREEAMAAIRSPANRKAARKATPQ